MIAVLLLVPFPMGMIFSPGSRHIKNDEISAGIGYLDYFIGTWQMPLLFVVSSAAAGHSLGFMARTTSVKDRFLRLVVPLVFGIPALVPPKQAGTARRDSEEGAKTRSGRLLDFTVPGELPRW